MSDPFFLDDVDGVDDIQEVDDGVDDIDGDDKVDDIMQLVQTVEHGLESSVFQVEPVTHITYQLLFVDEMRNIERIECDIMHLRQPNVIDRFDVARIIKRARGNDYRLTALLVYNVDLTLKEIVGGGCGGCGDESRFMTALVSISNFMLRPTLACFHSANSLHVVLTRSVTAASASSAAASATFTAAHNHKRHISIRPSTLTRRRR